MKHCLQSFYRNRIITFMFVLLSICSYNIVARELYFVNKPGNVSLVYSNTISNVAGQRLNYSNTYNLDSNKKYYVEIITDAPTYTVLYNRDSDSTPPFNLINMSLTGQSNVETLTGNHTYTYLQRADFYTTDSSNNNTYYDRHIGQKVVSGYVVEKCYRLDVTASNPLVTPINANTYLNIYEIPTPVFRNDGYINSSLPQNANTNKIVNYINSKKVQPTSTLFCVGRDKVKFYESFFDSEKDYNGLSQSQRPVGSQPSEALKKMDPNSIQFMLSHNPGYYDRAASKSLVSDNWYKGEVRWDSAVNKWRLYDPSGKILFEDLTDDLRGEWTINIKGKDSTGKPLFDKESVGFTKFRIHKPPVPKMKALVYLGNGYVRLQDNGSYDLDYMDRYGNLGIKTYSWSIKLNGSWVDVGSNKVQDAWVGGGSVTDYKLTVTDHDDVSASISLTMPNKEKPLADFNFLVASKPTSYINYGNVGNESLGFSSSISWNDDAFDPAIYNTSGTRYAKWINSKTRYNSTDLNTFKQNYNSTFKTSIQTNGTIGAELEVKNKYDLVDTKVKDITSREVRGSQWLWSSEMVEGKYIPGTFVGHYFTIDNAAINPDDVRVELYAPGIPRRVVERATDNIYRYEFTFPDYAVTGPNATFTIEVFSKRDGSLLHRQQVTVGVIVPLQIDFVGTQYYIPSHDSKVDIKTNKYVDRVDVTVYDNTGYAKTIAATKYKDTGEERFWTIAHKAPIDIPLQVYKIKAVGYGIANLSKQTIADFHYIYGQASVKHTDEWEVHRQKYNNYKTGNAELPRAKNVFFNGEKFVTEFNVLTSIPGQVTVNSVKASLIGTNFKGDLTKQGTVYKGSIFDNVFKDRWLSPAVYNLEMLFDLNINSNLPIAIKVPFKVDSTDPYWREHLKN